MFLRLENIGGSRIGEDHAGKVPVDTERRQGAEGTWENKEQKRSSLGFFLVAFINSGGSQTWLYIRIIQRVLAWA